VVVIDMPLKRKKKEEKKEEKKPEEKKAEQKKCWDIERVLRKICNPLLAS